MDRRDKPCDDRKRIGKEIAVEVGENGQNKSDFAPT